MPPFAPPRTAWSACLLFPFATWVHAQVVLDPLVVTGSRIAHSSFDLPAAIDVIDASRLDTDAARVNASEVLAGVPGIVVQNRQNYAQDLQISSRGFGARTAFGVRGIRLIADGIPVSMPDGQGQAATFNLDRAERIEVMRGPLSAIYGNAAGGVIQLFTRDGQGAPTTEGRFTAGSFGTQKIDTSFQGETEGIGYVLDASHFTTDGYRDHSAAQRNQQMAKLTFAPNSDGKVTLLANGFQQKAQDPLGLNWADYRRQPQGVVQAAIDYNTRKSIDHLQGGISLEQRFGDHTLQLSAYAGQRSTTQFQSFPKPTQTYPNYGVTNQANPKHAGGVIDFQRDFSGVSGRWIARHDVVGGALTTTVGFDYETATDNRQGYENYLGNALGVQGRLRRNEQDRVVSFDQFAQAEWQGERWTFSGGVRHSRVRVAVDDRYVELTNGDDSGRVSYGKTTPTAAAAFRLTPAVNLYASAARGFETPSLNELFYSGPGGSFSFALRPSTSTHLETGMKAMVGERSRIDLALFDIRTDDELVVASASDGRTAYRNAGRTQRQGLELSGDTAWGQGFTSRLALTQMRAVFEEAYTGSSGLVAAGNRIPGVAARQLYADLAWRHAASGFHIGLEAVGRSRVFVEDTNLREAAPAYAIANLRMGTEHSMGKLKLNTFARLDNLFDRQYVGSVIVGDSNNRFYEAAPGRNWLLGASLRYAL